MFNKEERRKVNMNKDYSYNNWSALKEEEKTIESISEEMIDGLFPHFNYYYFIDYSKKRYIILDGENTIVYMSPSLFNEINNNYNFNNDMTFYQIFRSVDELQEVTHDYFVSYIEKINNCLMKDLEEINNVVDILTV